MKRIENSDPDRPRTSTAQPRKYAVPTDNPALSRILPFIKERITIKLPSDVNYLNEVLSYINQRMVELGIIEQGDTSVLIALDEAIANAIKHGNKFDPRKTVRITAELSADGARFTVKDEGMGFARESVPDPTDPSRILEPSGRGLWLMSHMMDEVRFNDRGNEVHMLKRSARDSQRRARGSRRSFRRKE
jgi:serine/threonine-protein kinase RsbW